MLRWGKLIPEDLRRAFTERPYKLLILLVAADLVFISVHLLHQSTDLFPGQQYAIHWEYGYAERYQHIKEFWIVLLLLSLAVRTRAAAMFLWGLLFFYLLMDDTLRIHEYMGHHIKPYLGFDRIAGIKASNIGQHLWSFIVGVPILIILGALYTKSAGRIRSISNSLFALLLLLLFFGIFMDSVHSLYFNTVLGSLLHLIEEGGEILVMSVITWYVFSLEPDGEDRMIE